jgi:hypothetical protein
MLKKENLREEKTFNSLCDSANNNFRRGSSIFKHRISQSVFWDKVEKDLADQFFRDERWLFGIKYADEIKFIDHSGLDSNGKKIGF